MGAVRFKRLNNRKPRDWRRPNSDRHFIMKNEQIPDFGMRKQTERGGSCERLTLLHVLFFQNPGSLIVSSEIIRRVD